MQSFPDARVRHSVLITLSALVLLGGAGTAADEPARRNVIAFVTQADNSKGVVRCGLFTERGWLKDPVAPAISPVEGKKAVCLFRDIAPGTYGLSAFHDENNNGKLDTNFIGLPTEDYCASRDARGTFGPPKFADAKFKYSGGAMRLSARLQ